ncbi:MAG: hypothetical protein AB8G05_09095 [Oligoflexales bacterium]
MYLLLGHKSVDCILSKVLQRFKGVNRWERYLHLLATHSYLQNLEGTISKKPVFSDIKGLKTVAPKYYDTVYKDFSKNSKVNTERLCNGFFDDVILELSKRSVDIHQTFSFLVRYIIIHSMQQYTKGTTEDSLGLVIINGQDHLEKEDYIELMVHQMNHMIMFLDDKLNPQVSNENKCLPITLPINTAAGTRSMSFYVLLHSFMVGVEVLLFRKKFATESFHGAFHGSTSQLTSRCMHAFHLLADKRDYLLPRGVWILEAYREQLSYFQEHFL